MTERQLLRKQPQQDLGTDDAGCNILHVDMDAFFAAVEIRDQPQLRGLPVIIGRSEGRGVVTSATYEARAMGVHSAMPMGQARRLCPNAVIIEPSHGKYLAASQDVMTLLRELSPAVEEVSVDEAFLDVSTVARAIGPPAFVATMIRKRVVSELGLVCSIGVAPVTMVAKLASTQSKPDGLMIVPKARMLDFLHPLPVGKLWGVGSSTENRLKSLGIVTVGDLSVMPERRLAHTVGKSAAKRLLHLAHGFEVRPLQLSSAEKSIGSEVTFDVDTINSALIQRELRAACERVGRRLRTAGLVARQVTLKVRFDDFTTVNRSHTLFEPGDIAAAFYAAVRPMWLRLSESGQPIRLVGVRVEQLSKADRTGHQLTFDDHDLHWASAEKIVDQVVAKFGSRAVIPARMMKSDG